MYKYFCSFLILLERLIKFYEINGVDWIIRRLVFIGIYKFVSLVLGIRIDINFIVFFILDLKGRNIFGS